MLSFKIICFWCIFRHPVHPCLSSVLIRSITLHNCDKSGHKTKICVACDIHAFFAAFRGKNPIILACQLVKLHLIMYGIADYAAAAYRVNNTVPASLAVIMFFPTETCIIPNCYNHFAESGLKSSCFQLVN